MLLVATAMLVITGLLAVYTSSFAVGYQEFGDTNYFVGRQAVFALLGVGALILFMRMDYNRLRAWSVPMLLLALAGLIAVLLPGIGVERNGATRWLVFGPVSVQPSEFAKSCEISRSFRAPRRSGVDRWTFEGSWNRRFEWRGTRFDTERAW